MKTIQLECPVPSLTPSDALVVGEIGDDGFYHPTDEDVERIMRRVAYHRYASNKSNDPAREGCTTCGLTKKWHLHSMSDNDPVP